MQMIFNRTLAEELADRYIVLELEPHIVQDAVLETFCVVESEKIPLTEVTMLDHWINFNLKSFELKQYLFC